MRRIIRYLLLAGVVIFILSSCLALPKAADKRGTLLVIPVTAENTSDREEWLAKYHLHLREYRAPIVITPQNGYVYVKDLRPDTIYNAEMIRSVLNRRRVNLGEPKILNAAVWTKSGSVSIFPYRIEVVQEQHPVNSWQTIQKLSLHLLSVSEKAEIAQDLSRYRNFDTWSSVMVR